MIKSILPNCRWLSLPSEDLGRDWALKSQEIDRVLESLGMDLAEESVYILFDRSPGAVLDGQSHAAVARSVIGPKKLIDGEFKLLDWVAGMVHRQTLKAKDWDNIQQECYQLWEELHRQGIEPKKGYMLLLKRRLKPQLTLSIEVLFTC